MNRARKLVLLLALGARSGAAQQPSLQETLDWLKGTLDQWGGGRSWNGSTEPYYAIGYHSLRLTRATGCDLEFQVGYWGSYMQGEDTERRRPTEKVDFPLKLRLSEFSPDIIRLGEGQYTFVDYYLTSEVKYFANTEKHPNASFDVLRLSRTVGTGGTVSGTVDLFVSRSVADRVVRALRNAIGLCGGKRESALFTSDAPPPAPPPAPAPAPPPATTGRDIPGSAWRATEVKVHEGPKAGVAWADRKYYRRYSNAALRSVFIVLSFEGPAGTPPLPAVACTLGKTGSHWVARVQIPEQSIDPGWSSFSTTMPGIGGNLPGGWALGPHEVHCTSGNTPIGETTFEVVQKLSVANWVATDLLLYEGPDGGVPAEDRRYATLFSAAGMRRIFIELRFELQAGVVLGRPIECTVSGKGTRGVLSIDAQADPTWTTLVVGSSGWGWSDAGHWMPGVYGVTCATAGRQFASSTFEIAP